MSDLVTIGITCYNAELTINRAIESAICQDYQNKEILIVDDCSSDNSQNLIINYTSKFRNIYLFKHDVNKGPSGSRNTIIKNANGKYIIFFDDDDESYNDRVLIQKKYIDDYISNEKKDMVLCYASGKRKYANNYTLNINAIGSKFKAPDKKLLDYLLYNKKELIYDYGSGVPTCSLMALKKTFVYVGLFDENLSRVEDADFAIRFTMMGGKIVGTKEILFTQYSTKAQDKNPINNFLSEKKLINKNKDYLLSIDMYKYSIKWAELRYLYFNKNYIKFFLIFSLIFFNQPNYALNHAVKSMPRRLIHEIKMIDFKNLLPLSFKKILRLIKKNLIYNLRFFKLKIAIYANKKLYLILGSAETYQINWYSTNEQWLDITNNLHWKRLFKNKQKVEKMVAEHVFEHLTIDELNKALKLIHFYLKKKGRIRIAVPDGNNPNEDYLNHVKINGIGADAADHKQLFNFNSLQSVLIKHKFEPFILEGYLDNKLICNDFADKDGYIIRTRKRNKLNIIDSGWNFPDSNTSLIIDAFKK